MSRVIHYCGPKYSILAIQVRELFDTPDGSVPRTSLELRRLSKDRGLSWGDTLKGLKELIRYQKVTYFEEEDLYWKR